jgi:hypothetical protein
MAGSRSAAFLPGQFHLLARAFERASLMLSEAEVLPSVEACLADKVLAVVAAGECDPARVSAAALASMRDCLRDCTGCHIVGLSSSIAAGVAARSSGAGNDVGRHWRVARIASSARRYVALPLRGAILGRLVGNSCRRTCAVGQITGS